MILNVRVRLMKATITVLLLTSLLASASGCREKRENDAHPATGRPATRVDRNAANGGLSFVVHSPASGTGFILEFDDLGRVKGVHVCESGNTEPSLVRIFDYDRRLCLDIRGHDVAVVSFNGEELEYHTDSFVLEEPYGEYTILPREGREVVDAVGVPF